MIAASRILHVLVAAALMGAVGATDATAQMQFDRWARSADMGDAMAAVFWGGDPDAARRSTTTRTRRARVLLCKTADPGPGLTTIGGKERGSAMRLR